jgi:hypothetical protein
MQVDLFTSRNILMHEVLIHFNCYLLIYSFLMLSGHFAAECCAISLLPEKIKVGL